jgi:hypothetical protein
MRCLLLAALALAGVASPAGAQEACNGETLISPLYSNDTYLIDMDLNVIKTWHCSNPPGFVAYLLEDGSILRPCTYPGGAFYGGGLGGRIQRYDAEGNLTWDYLFSTYAHAQHHDVHRMPSGNVLLIAWERKTRAEAIAAGRVNISGEIWPDALYEIEPVGATGGNVVWEWHLWDHLIQDADPTKNNYGVVGDHPELLDLNLGTVSGMGGGDWVHVNTIDYNPQLDQVTFSSHYLNEFYVIDHSTTTAQAAGHTGGNSGMGGDILYRWGNPQNYRAGDAGDQVFFVVHGVNWIDPGLPGQGNLLVFNNGDRPGTANDYSSVEEIVPPLNGFNYDREPGQPFGPAAPTWIYSQPGAFYSGHWSGAYRLPNGNTLITEALSGHVFEVSEAGETVWSYQLSNSLARALRYHMATSAVDPTLPIRRLGQLLPNQPNPFQLSTRIPFELYQPGRVQMEIFSLGGRRIVTLIDAALADGRHGIEWNGRDASGCDVASGTYLVRLRIGESVEAERLVLMR